MARGPDGAKLLDELEEDGTLVNDELVFARALERIIDGALERHPPGDTFVYGIHQELSPEMTEAIVRRYRGAGWSHVVLRTGTAGAHLLILRP